MIGILLDVYEGEGKVSELSLKRDSSLVIFEAYQRNIFEKHGIEKASYKKSLTYYYDHPKQLEKIYESVLDSLNIKEQKLKEAREKKVEEDKEEREKSKLEKDKKE